MNFDHGITYVAIYLDTLTCLFLHTRLLKAHTKLLEAHTRLLETLSLSLSLLWSTVSGLLVKREAFSPCPQSVTPASHTPGLPKYIQKHRIIDINATDLCSGVLKLLLPCSEQTHFRCTSLAGRRGTSEHGPHLNMCHYLR